MTNPRILNLTQDLWTETVVPRRLNFKVHNRRKLLMTVFNIPTFLVIKFLSQSSLLALKNPMEG